MAPQAYVSNHPGSTAREVADEPDWGFGHNHRIGFINNEDRHPGFTHDGDHEEEDEMVEEDAKKVEAFKARLRGGDLINFRDIMSNKTDFHLQHPNDHPPGWRFMVDVSEDWVKQGQDWPANQKARDKVEAKAKSEKTKGESSRSKDSQAPKSGPHEKKQSDQEAQGGDRQPLSDSSTQGASSESADHDSQPDGASHEKSADRPHETGGNAQKGTEHSDHWGKGDEQDDEESRWKRDRGDKSKAHGALDGGNLDEDEGYHSGSSSSAGGQSSKSDYEKLREKYTPTEISLLRMLQHEREYIANLGQNDGKGKSPVADRSHIIDIDVADQFGPDNWIPRSGNLIRNTGKHPLNAETPLNELFAAGTVTPNHQHYVRNHGAVPRLYWETHKLDIENGALVFSMDDLENKFEAINIAVALGCDGNRRGELNLVRKSKGFTWGAGAISCAYWKGVPLRDLLLEAGVTAKFSPSQRRYVNFAGSEDLTDGKYETSIPLEYAMDPANDVIVAYEMNDVKLPPDHGFPCRIIIPGYVGGRSVKWLARIWTSDTENESHYHIWDNRVLPSFITEKDGEFADTMFRHPSTACMEQNLNSIITKPAQGERMTFAEVETQKTYRVEGIAYDGGGHEVQRVELSLDDGQTWLYCMRKYPDRPIRHGSKWWTWLHWHIEIDTGHFIEAKSLTVRCFNVFKNTQPRESSWNTMGMMCNGWYVVKPSLEAPTGQPGSKAGLIFKHPVDPKDNQGWMEPSPEVQLQAAKADTGVPDKQFTRQEIEKHNQNSDCWLVINNKVFDVTSVLSWHPGGVSSILSYGGKLTQETTSSFESIHDEFAAKKLNECVIGRMTDRAANFVKQSAQKEAEEAAKSAKASSDILLQKQRWTPVVLADRKSLSKDTRSYTFKLPAGKKSVGVGTCQHIQFGFHTKDKMLIRSYTPTRPIIESEEDGTFELVIKTYFPTPDQPGGAFSNFIDCMPVGEQVDVRGPTGEIRYKGNGVFDISGEERRFSKLSLILGGSGITPGYQLFERILKTKGDTTQIRIVDANKSEEDILLRKELDMATKEHDQQCQIEHVLSHPSDAWKGTKGHVNADIIRAHCFPPGEDSCALLCGPPTMIQKAALPALKDWGYQEDRNCFGF